MSGDSGPERSTPPSTVETAATPSEPTAGKTPAGKTPPHKRGLRDVDRRIQLAILLVAIVGVIVPWGLSTNWWKGTPKPPPPLGSLGLNSFHIELLLGNHANLVGEVLILNNEGGPASTIVGVEGISRFPNIAPVSLNFWGEGFCDSRRVFMTSSHTYVLLVKPTIVPLHRHSAPTIWLYRHFLVRLNDHAPIQVTLPLSDENYTAYEPIVEEIEKRCAQHL